MSHPEDLLQHIRRLVAPAVDVVTDSILLERFCASHDEAAFAALVARHGPMVFHVCRRLLTNASDSDDAFQATFLILARRADSIRPRDALAGWLHGVARRVALRSQAASRSRPRSLTASPPDPHRDPLAEVSARELLTIIDDEVRKLPQAYRLPVILCCLEGHTLEEAAAQLGWTVGSVKGRLERGRQRLQKRLVRRGVTLSLVLSVAGACRAAVPGALVTATTKLTSVTGVASAPILALAEGVMSTMKWSKWCLVLTLALGTALAGTGVALIAGQGGNSPAKAENQRKADKQPRLLVPNNNAEELAKKLKSLREARLVAARTANATAFDQYIVGRLLQEGVYHASRQLLDAELALAKTKAERLRAYKDHRDRMKKLSHADKIRFKAGRVSIEASSMAESYYLEAEIWLLEATTAKTKATKP